MKPLSRQQGLQTGPSALALAAATPADAQVARAPQNFRVLSAPVVQDLSPTAVSVAWAVNDTSTGWVEYGEPADCLSQPLRHPSRPAVP